MTPAMYTAQTNLINALVTFLNGEKTRLTPEHADFAAVCSRMALLLVEFSSLTPANDGNYDIRSAAVDSMSATYAALSNVLTQSRLQSLQYNGIEIDTELIRIFLFGQNLVAMPNP